MRAAMAFPSIPNLSALRGGLPAVLNAYQPPLIALGVALLLGVAGRAGPRVIVLRVVGAAAGAGGVLAGWIALLPWTAALHAVLTPRALPDFLLLPAVAVLLAQCAAPWLSGRAERWLPLAPAVLAGWWLARSGPARPEFWRVWLAVGVMAWLLARAVASQGARATAAALALWGGLLVAGAPSVWIAAALVAVAGALADWALGAALTPVLLVIVAAAADLAGGRLVRAGLNGVDLAAFATIGAAWLAPWLTTRFGNPLGRAGPAAAALAAAGLAVGLCWLGIRLIQR